MEDLAAGLNGDWTMKRVTYATAVEGFLRRDWGRDADGRHKKTHRPENLGPVGENSRDDETRLLELPSRLHDADRLRGRGAIMTGTGGVHGRF
jgi:hypothetical protein